MKPFGFSFSITKQGFVFRGGEQEAFFSLESLALYLHNLIIC